MHLAMEGMEHEYNIDVSENMLNMLTTATFLVFCNIVLSRQKLKHSVRKGNAIPFHVNISLHKHQLLIYKLVNIASIEK